MQRPEEMSIWIEYFDGKEVYRIRTAIDTTIMFQPEARKIVGMMAENMWYKMEKEVVEHA